MMSIYSYCANARRLIRFLVFVCYILQAVPVPRRTQRSTLVAIRTSITTQHTMEVRTNYTTLCNSLKASLSLRPSSFFCQLDGVPSSQPQNNRISAHLSYDILLTKIRELVYFLLLQEIAGSLFCLNYSHI